LHHGLLGLILARAEWPFGMVASVLETLHDFGLICLLGFGEFSNVLLVNVRDLPESLDIAQLSGAVRTCLP